MGYPVVHTGASPSPPKPLRCGGNRGQACKMLLGRALGCVQAPRCSVGLGTAPGLSTVPANSFRGGRAIALEKKKQCKKKKRLQDLWRCLPSEEAAAVPFVTSGPRAASAVSGLLPPGAKGRGTGENPQLPGLVAGAACTCVHTHTDTDTLTCAHTRAHRYSYKSTRMLACLCTRMHAWTRAHTCAPTHTHI